MNILNSVMHRINRWEHSSATGCNGFFTRWVLPRVGNIGVVVLEPIAVAQNAIKLPFQPFGVALKCLIKVTFVCSDFQFLHKIDNSLPGIGDIFTTIKKVCEYVFATLFSATVGFIVPSWNFKLQVALDLIKKPDLLKRRKKHIHSQRTEELKQKQEQERLKKQQELERQELEAQKAQQERERLEQERLQKQNAERLEQERVQQQKEQERLELAAQQEMERLKQERAQQQKENEKLEQERQEEVNKLAQQQAQLTKAVEPSKTEDLDLEGQKKKAADIKLGESQVASPQKETTKNLSKSGINLYDALSVEGDSDSEST